jgi:hypothetical protein
MISKIEPSTNTFYVKGKFIKPPITRPNWRARKNLPPRSNPYQSHSTSNPINNYSLIPSSTTIVVFQVIRYQTAEKRKEIRPVNLPNLIPIILAKTTLISFQCHCYKYENFIILVLGFQRKSTYDPTKVLVLRFPNLPTDRTIVLGDNSVYQSIAFSFVLLQLPKGQTLFIKDILHVSGLAKNLFFMAQITMTRICHTDTIFVTQWRSGCQQLVKEAFESMNMLDHTFIFLHIEYCQLFLGINSSH